MALIIPLSSEADAPVIQKVITDTTRIQGVLFNFDNTSALAFIAFGNTVDGEFTVMRMENWLLSGTFYLNSILSTPKGDSMADALLGSTSSIIIQIQSDAVLKQSLLDNDELRINSNGIPINAFNQF